jgi:hypothetical protein
MNLSAPSQLVFWISLILVICALVGTFWPGIAMLTAYAFWLAIAGWVVLAVGCMMKGA